jgi:hypothetical protein
LEEQHARTLRTDRRVERDEITGTVAPIALHASPLETHAVYQELTGQVDKDALVKRAIESAGPPAILVVGDKNFARNLIALASRPSFSVIVVAVSVLKYG